MLDTRPQEEEWRSWLWAALWTAVILVTIPLARVISDRVADSFGAQIFLWLTAAAIVAGIMAGLLVLAKRRLPASAWLCLAIFGGGLLWMAWTLRGNPVEAFHLVQYGVLSILLYRALLHRVSDNGIYAQAAVLAGIVGILDEWIQWLIPGRYWGIRDVLINFISAALTQGALATGLRPGIVHGMPSGSSMRRLCYALAVLLGMLCASYANTPDRIAWYAARIPGTGFLLDSQSMMVEYGHRYEDPEIGLFRSRFDRQALRRLDQQRGPDVAGVLDEFLEDGDWERFRETYTVPRDPYVHEIGTHLFRRNRHLSLARDGTRPDWQRRDSYLIAQRENRILEKYFPLSLDRSVHRWEAATRAEVDGMARKKDDYESWVSVNLITGLGRRQVLGGFCVTIGLVLVIGTIAGRSSTKSVQIDRKGESQ